MLYLEMFGDKINIVLFLMLYILTMPVLFVAKNAMHPNVS